MSNVLYSRESSIYYSALDILENENLNDICNEGDEIKDSEEESVDQIPENPKICPENDLHLNTDLEENQVLQESFNDADNEMAIGYKYKEPETNDKTNDSEHIHDEVPNKATPEFNTGQDDERKEEEVDYVFDKKYEIPAPQNYKILTKNPFDKEDTKWDMKIGNGNANTMLNGNSQEKTLEQCEEYGTKYYQITKLNLYLPWLSMLLYMTDVISDQVLAVRYGFKKQWEYAIITSVLVLIPSLYISIYIGQTRRQINANGWKYWAWAIPIWIFNLEPAIQYYKNFTSVRNYFRAKKSENRALQMECYDTIIAGNRNVTDLRYSECLMEAVPQLTLQVYIILTSDENLQTDDTIYLQFGSLASSILGLAITIFIRHKVFLLAHGYQVTMFGRTLWTIGRFFSLVPRTLAITAAASVYPAYTFTAFGIHWILAAIWRYSTHIRILGYFEPIMQAAADSLVPRVDSLTSNIISNIVILTEDVAMVVLWMIFSPNTGTLNCVLFGCFVIALNVVGSLSDVLYQIYSKRFTSKLETVEIST